MAAASRDRRAARRAGSAALLALLLAGAGAPAGAMKLQKLAPDLGTAGAPAPTPAKPAAKPAAGVAAPHPLENGALAISPLWLETEVKQDAVATALKYKGQVLEIEGLLKDKSLSGDTLRLVVSADPKKSALRGILCTVTDPPSVQAGGALHLAQPVTVAGKVAKIPDPDHEAAAALEGCIVLTGHPDPAAANQQVAALAGVAAPAPAGAAAGAAKSTERSGTAYFVSADGYLLTSSEAVKGCRSLSSPAAAGQPLAIVQTDSVNDLVLLKLPGGAPAVARFHSGPGVRLGDTVRLAGYPAPAAGGGAAAFDLATGVVSGLTGTNNDTRILKVTTPAGPGTAGAPLLDDRGAVIAQLVPAADTGDKKDAGATETATAAPDAATGHIAVVADLIRRFLEINGVRYRAAAANDPPTDEAGKFAVPIVCQP